MKTEKLSINGLKNVLSPSEMKQVTGGVESGTFFWCYYNNIEKGSGIYPGNEWQCLDEMCNYYSGIYSIGGNYGANVLHCVCQNSYYLEKVC